MGPVEGEIGGTEGQGLVDGKAGESGESGVLFGAIQSSRKIALLAERDLPMNARA